MKSRLESNRNRNDVPDPDVSEIHMRGPYILVRPLEVEDAIETQSGFRLLLPDETQDTYRNSMCAGKVLAVSPNAFNKEYQGDVKPIEVGDYVVYAKLKAEMKLPMKNLDVVFINADHIFAIVDKPHALRLSNYALKG